MNMRGQDMFKISFIVYAGLFFLMGWFLGVLFGNPDDEIEDIIPSDMDNSFTNIYTIDETETINAEFNMEDS